MSSERNLKGACFAIATAVVMAFTGLSSLSPTVQATPDVLRMLTTKEWFQDGPTGMFSVTSADLDGDGTAEVIVGGTSYAYPVYPPPPQNWPRGYLAVFHYGGCMKTLELLDYYVWDALPPYRDTLVYSVAFGDIDTTINHPWTEIVTAGYTRNANGYYRGELILWGWEGTPRSLNRLGSTAWPPIPNDPAPAYAYSVLAANIDSDTAVEVVTAGSYGDPPIPDLQAWAWSNGFSQDGQGLDTGQFRPAAWKGVSVGNVDGDPMNVQEIVTVGHGTEGSDTVGILQIWQKSDSSLSPKLLPEYHWHAPGHVATANGTYVGPLDSLGNVRILTVGSATDSGWAFQQEMKIFDWDGSSLTEQASKSWKPISYLQAWGAGTYAADVDMDLQVEELAVGFSATSNAIYADLSIWHWDGPGYDIVLDGTNAWSTWTGGYLGPRADGVFVGNANGDLDDIPEIITTGTVTYIVYQDIPSRKGQLRMWDWNLQVPNVWTDVTSNPYPSARVEHAMAYDSHAKRTILFGGWNWETSRLMDDTWEHDAQSNTWTPLSPIDYPSQRRESAMVYDVASDSTILFGGTASSNLRDTWEFKYGPPASWQLVSATGDIPPAVYSPAMVYDETHGVSYLFGGWDQDNNQWPRDMYRYDHASRTWENLGGSNPPSGRSEHAMAYNCKRDKIVLFGGVDQSGPFLDDTWEYDEATNSWTKMTLDHSPARREMVTMYYDVQGEVVVLFGGAGLGQRYDDTWVYDGLDWTDITSPPSPPRRAEAAMTYDLSANRGILFGGSDGTTIFADTWQYRYS